MKFFILLFSFFSYSFSQEFYYGSFKNQNYDLYMPISSNKKVLIFVHGGAWKYGDKTDFIEKKKEYFLNKGFIVSSINYRLFPSSINNQLSDIEASINHIQLKLGNSFDYILIGHSAGAHLVSLLNFKEDLLIQKTFSSVISLDTAALDVVSIMEDRHFHFYNDVFGNNKSDWIFYSPFYKNPNKQLSPMLLVCSEERKLSCNSSYLFKNKMKDNFNFIYPVNKTHKEISSDLGIDLDYSEKILSFIL